MRVVLSVLLVIAFLGAPAPSFAKEKKLKPISDYNRMSKAMRRATDEERKQAALEYLEKWEATGRTAKGTTRYGLAQFEQMAEQYKQAFDGFRSVRRNEEEKAKNRDYASTAEANLLTLGAFRVQLGKEALDKAAAELEKYADAIDDKARIKSRGKLQGLLAILHTMAGRSAASRNLRLKIIAGDKKALSKHVRPIMQGLLGETHKLSDYDVVRKKAAGVIQKLTGIQNGVVAAAKEKLDAARGKLPAGALDAEGNLKQTDRKAMTKPERAYGGAKISYDRAKGILDSLAPNAAPFELLGKPAAAWTLEKAYTEDVTELAALKGKVVVLDFWNTWGPACSFPVIRDLLRDYGEKGLAVVGVTATSNVVYPSRYDFDPDFKSKDTGEMRYAARLASESQPANGSYILDEAEYKVREIEAIRTFIENHEMTWPVVQIDKDELAGKYAQDTWPHTVIIDKQGRLRFVRGGALERDKQVSVAKIKKVLEDLLSE